MKDMKNFQKSAADRGSREQIKMLLEINARAETTDKQRAENNRRFVEHVKALEKRRQDDT